MTMSSAWIDEQVPLEPLAAGLGMVSEDDTHSLTGRTERCASCGQLSDMVLLRARATLREFGCSVRRRHGRFGLRVRRRG